MIEHIFVFQILHLHPFTQLNEACPTRWLMKAITYLWQHTRLLCRIVGRLDVDMLIKVIILIVNIRVWLLSIVLSSIRIECIDNTHTLLLLFNICHEFG